MFKRIIALAFSLVVAAQAQQPAPAAQRQIAALLAEKAARNPAQRKIDSHLIHAAAIVAGRAVHPDFPKPTGALEAVRADARNYVEIDILADVSGPLLAYIRSLNGTVVNAFPEYRSIRASLPLAAVETLAARDEVQLIRIADYGHGGAGPDQNGDIAHKANLARMNLGFDGSGVKVGVLSDGLNSLAAEQAAGRLPANVNVIAGQAGNGDEGTAMLEIVYTLAPGATLYYATASGGQANMANNIQALADAGCKIIIDDWTYFAEGVFQDDVVARKVNAVAAAGVLYFTDAQNSGSLLKGNSGTWEGDFVDSGLLLPPIATLLTPGGPTHNFGTAANPINYDTLTALTPTGGFTGNYELKWSDPLGHSSNDYDLFILDPSLTTVLGYSTNAQTGTQNPEEHIPANNSFPAGARIVVVKHPSAEIRTLHLDTERGRLAIGTNGATFGHNAAAGAFTMAAADVQTAHGGAFTGGTDNPSYFYTSDGPRRMFYNADGSPTTPGYFTIASGGGTVLNKPDFTAADGVTTGVSGYLNFYGTSAAGPHAGAIAALALQAKPSLTNAQLRAAFTSSALDIEAPGFDVNSGAGIVMGPGTVSAVIGLPAFSVSLQHAGNFSQGQIGASSTIVISNAAGGVPSSGTVSAAVTLPSGFIQASLSGAGWNCAGATCSRTDALAPGASYPTLTLTVNVAANATSPLIDQVTVTNGGAIVAQASDSVLIAGPPPAILPGGIGPLYSKATTIEPGSWASLYGTGFSTGIYNWAGDFPTSLGGVSVRVNGKLAYLWYVSPTLINFEAPDDTATGPVTVTVNGPSGSASSTVTLGVVGPSLNMFDGTHPAAIILTPDGSGKYAGGVYDVLGPTGGFVFNTRPVKPGEVLVLYGTGFGPTNPAIPAGKPTLMSAATVNPVSVTLAGTSVTPISAVVYATGAYQIAIRVPSAPSGDQPLMMSVAGSQIPANIVVAVR